MRELFVVVRRSLTQEGYFCSDQSGCDTGSRVPLRLFFDRHSAEIYAAELTVKTRPSVNPFLAAESQLHPKLCERLRQLDFPLPAPDDTWGADWREWWDLCQDEVTDSQREQAWTILADYALFEVVPVELGDE